MTGNRNSKGDYYRQRCTDREVHEVAHGDCGMDTYADRHDSGEMQFQMSGRPPQNEQGNEPVATLLAEALTARYGAEWTAELEAPTGPERGIDWNIFDWCETEWPVQITRIGSEARWEKARHHGVTANVTAAEAAREIAEAIERKLPSQDDRTILALSAGQPGYWVFEDVVSEFKRTCLPELQPKLRYPQVWLVGYSLETTLPLWLNSA